LIQIYSKNLIEIAASALGGLRMTLRIGLPRPPRIVADSRWKWACRNYFPFFATLSGI